MRKGPARVSVSNHEISFRYRTSEKSDFVSAPVHNIGPGGLSATLSPALTTGTPLEFELTIGTGKVIKGTGTVSWKSRKAQSNGMAFIDLNEHAKEILLLWLASQK